MAVCFPLYRPAEGERHLVGRGRRKWPSYEASVISRDAVRFLDDDDDDDEDALDFLFYFAPCLNEPAIHELFRRTALPRL